MFRTTIRGTAAAALLSLGGGAAHGADLFNLDLSVITPQAANGSATLNTITNLADEFTTENLNALVRTANPGNLAATYTDVSAATANVNLRGLAATVSYQQNSPVLRFTVPSAGIDVTFNGATRDESQRLFRDFLLKNGGSTLTRLLQALVASSPIDPVAGNPNSLQNLSARSDFEIGTGIGMGASEIPSPRNGGLAGHPNLVTVGGDIGIANSGGFTSTVVTAPIRYIVPFKDPRYAITFDLPLSYVSTAGAASYLGSFGVAVRIPVLENWYLTPSLRIGAAGSLDVGAAAVQYSGGLASRYDIFFDDLRLTIGNAVTVVRTGGVSFGSVSVNYDLTNALFTNGVQLEGSLPYTVFGQPTNWQAYIIDTTVTGSKVYINHYDEIGVTVGTRHGLNTQNWDSLRVGFAVTVGSHYNAYKLALSYRF